jgi:polyphosphate kinase
MSRNLDRRVEIAFPMLEPPSAQIRHILETQLSDTVKGTTHPRRRAIGANRRDRRGPPLSSQERLCETAGVDGRAPARAGWTKVQ